MSLGFKRYMALKNKMQRVLIVEDDLYSIRFMESSLRLSGFETHIARSYADGRAELEKLGCTAFSAVLTDYRLPRETGLDLLEWIHDNDPALATVVITGQGEKSIVESSLKLGAFRYLEKPVTHQTLKGVMLEAAKRTSRIRQSVSDRKGLEDLEHLDKQLSIQIPDALSDQIELIYKPLHEIGGDFFLVHHVPETETLILVGDVSGHDIKSGYASTYFQGMFRGSVENGASVTDFLNLFNKTLRQQDLEAVAPENRVSLSLVAIHLTEGSFKFKHWNYGMPPCIGVSKAGQILTFSTGRFPLGWVSELNPKPDLMNARHLDYLYIFTDGLFELAAELNRNPCAVLFRLIKGEKNGYDLSSDRSDDILVLKYSFQKQRPLNATYEPIISEHYAGTEVDHIDQLQSNWRRNLVFALDDKLGDRIYDLLICIREGMINALTHGCERSPEKFAHLQISLHPSGTSLRVVIDDPGKGHDFDLEMSLESIRRQEGKHLGLGMIQHLSNEFAIENKGTSLMFDFELTPEAPERKD